MVAPAATYAAPPVYATPEIVMTGMNPTASLAAPPVYATPQMTTAVAPAATYAAPRVLTAPGAAMTTMVPAATYAAEPMAMAGATMAAPAVRTSLRRESPTYAALGNMAVPEVPAPRASWGRTSMANMSSS